MQTESRASVWPYLAIGENYSSLPGQETFTWRVDNNGVGPAKIESVQVGLDDKSYRTWEKLSAALVPDHPLHGAQTSINGTVLPASLNRETTIELVKLVDPILAKAFRDAQPRFKIAICYCSVYDDCWIAHIDDRVRHTAVERCDTAGTVQFDG